MLGTEEGGLQKHNEPRFTNCSISMCRQRTQSAGGFVIELILPFCVEKSLMGLQELAAFMNLWGGGQNQVDTFL